MITIVVVTVGDPPWVEPTTELLRAHGANVVLLPSVGVVGVMLMYNKVAAVVIDDQHLPPDWMHLRQAIHDIAPGCLIELVSPELASTPSAIVARVLQ